MPNKDLVKKIIEIAVIDVHNREERIGALLGEEERKAGPVRRLETPVGSASFEAAEVVEIRVNRKSGGENRYPFKGRVVILRAEPAGDNRA